MCIVSIFARSFFWRGHLSTFFPLLIVVAKVSQLLFRQELQESDDQIPLLPTQIGFLLD